MTHQQEGIELLRSLKSDGNHNEDGRRTEAAEKVNTEDFLRAVDERLKALL